MIIHQSIVGFLGYSLISIIILSILMNIQDKIVHGRLGGFTRFTEYLWIITWLLLVISVIIFCGSILILSGIGIGLFNS